MEEFDSFVFKGEKDGYRLWYDTYDGSSIYEKRSFTDVWKEIRSSIVPKDVKKDLIAQVQRRLLEQESNFQKNENNYILRPSFIPILNKENEFVIPKEDKENAWRKWVLIFEAASQKLKGKSLYSRNDKHFSFYLYFTLILWAGPKFEKYEQKKNKMLKSKWIKLFKDQDSPCGKRITHPVYLALAPAIIALNSLEPLSFQSIFEIQDFEGKPAGHWSFDSFLSSIEIYDLKAKNLKRKINRNLEEQEWILQQRDVDVEEDDKLYLQELEKEYRKLKKDKKKVLSEQKVYRQTAQNFEVGVMKFLSKLSKEKQWIVRNTLFNLPESILFSKIKKYNCFQVKRSWQKFKDDKPKYFKPEFRQTVDSDFKEDSADDQNYTSPIRYYMT